MFLFATWSRQVTQITLIDSKYGGRQTISEERIFKWCELLAVKFSCLLLKSFLDRLRVEKCPANQLTINHK